MMAPCEGADKSVGEKPMEGKAEWPTTPSYGATTLKRSPRVVASAAIGNMRGRSELESFEARNMKTKATMRFIEDLHFLRTLAVVVCSGRR